MTSIGWNPCGRVNVLPPGNTLSVSLMQHSFGLHACANQHASWRKKQVNICTYFRRITFFVFHYCEIILFYIRHWWVWRGVNAPISVTPSVSEKGAQLKASIYSGADALIYNIYVVHINNTFDIFIPLSIESRGWFLTMGKEQSCFLQAPPD